MKPKFFKDPKDFRKWLEKNHGTKTELIVGYYKVKTKKPSMKWAESVDEAVCFGWIDGIRRSIDEESYNIRFTPRRKDSIWSAVNIKKVKRLIEEGLMQPAGLLAYENREESKSAIYSYENKPKELSPELEKIFKSNKIAWDFFIEQAPSYQRLMVFRVISAKKEETKIRRLNKLIESSEELKRLK